MSFLPGLVKLVKKVAAPLGHIIEGIPGVGQVFKTAEGVGGAIEKGLKLVKKVPLPVDIAVGAGAAAGGGALIASSGHPSGAPALPGGGGAMIPGGGSYGLPAIRGKGALINPQIAQAVMSMALPASYLRTYYRAPRGYVIVHGANGQIAAIPKVMAVRYGLYHHPHKPPISAGDWHKYQVARRVEKKLRMLAVHALRHHHSGRRYGRETAAQERAEHRHHK
jgi:hypothetical protein